LEEAMKKLIVAAVALLMPALAAAQVSLDGTWKIDVASAKFPEKPESYVLKDGRFTCSTCVPTIDVKADGKDHPVTGSNYFNTIAVTIVDANVVRFTSKKDGKVVQESTDTVGSDGMTLTEELTGFPPAGEPVKGKVINQRVDKGPAGSHALSGSWRATKAAEFSDSGLTVTFKTTPNGLSMSAPTGESYDAKFDGKDYPLKGDPGGSLVSLKRIDNRTIEETTKRDNKVVRVARLTLSPDGQTLNFVTDDKERGTTMTVAAKKQ
jgi:hypothetical protein